MTEAVQLCHEIIFRRVGRIFFYDSIQFGIVWISEKHRFDIGIVHTNMLHTVFFFITTGQFMFLDVTFQIIIYISTYNQTILCTSVHRLCIYIILFLLILNQPAFLLKQPEVFSSLFINSRIMFVCSYRKIYFRLNNMI